MNASRDLRGVLPVAGHVRTFADTQKGRLDMNSRFQLVVDALDEVAGLRRSDFRGNDAAVLRLLHEYGDSNDLANLLWNDLSTEVRTQRRDDVSDLLGLWVWRTPDNGSRIRDAQEAWLRECDDENKVWVALHREGIPFCMKHGLRHRAAEVFPALAHLAKAVGRNRASATTASEDRD